MMVHGYDREAVFEDLAWLDETSVGATEAAERTGFPNAEALEKWLTRHDRYDLWQKLKRRDPPGTHDTKARQRQRRQEKTRVCSKCDVEKPITEFYKNGPSKGGRLAHCITCNNSKRRPTELRLLRNRARARATAALIKLHADEFERLYDQELETARVEHQELKVAAAQRGQPDAEVARLKPGMKREGQTSAVERLDVARCPSCHTHHDAGHECPGCGDTTPEAAPRIKPWVVRTWASEQGIEVPTRGRIPDAVQAAYDEAHSEAAS